MGSWIKMRHDLLDAPEIRPIARATGTDRDQVLGKLFRLWSWFDRHGTNGQIDGGDLDAVDEMVGLPGFAAALVSVGWLAEADGGIEIPHWDRHNSESAKERALKRTRMERLRGAASATGSAGSVALGAPLDKTREEVPPPPREVSQGDRDKLVDAWKAAAKLGHVKPWNAQRLPHGADELLAEPGWLDDAIRAIAWLPKCRRFETPATLIQLCKRGFVEKVLGHQYDDPKPKPKGLGDDKPPPRVFSGEDAAAFERTRAKLAQTLRAETGA